MKRHRRIGGTPMASNKETYVEAKRVLAEIQHELDSQPLTAAQRNELELHAARLAGAIHRPWLPVSAVSRIMMVGIVVLGLQQAWVGNYQPMLWWLLLPFFSPRFLEDPNWNQVYWTYCGWHCRRWLSGVRSWIHHRYIVLFLPTVVVFDQAGKVSISRSRYVRRYL
jgi:hypothetical protein